MPTPAKSTTLIEKHLNQDLLQELGIDALTPEEATAFFSSFGNIIWQRIILRLEDELTDDQKQKLESVLATESDNTEAITSFFTNEVEGFEDMVNEEVAEYKKELLDQMQAVNGAMA
mgnify:CR=1 FL=1